MIKFELSSREIVNEFNNENKKGHIFQTSYWCDFKKDWKQYYIHAKNSEGKIILTASLILRKIPYTNKFIGYIPRGFVCDYSDKYLMKCFAEYLRGFAKENKISFVTIDADIHYAENEIKTEHGSKIKKNLEDAGFISDTSESKNFESIQPNFVFRLNIENKDNLDKKEVKDRVFNNFHKKWRYNIKLGSQRFLETEWYDHNNVSDEMVTEFHNIMVETGERDNFLVRNKTYFKELIEKNGPYARLYMVKYNLKKDKEAALAKIEKQMSECKDLEIKVSEFAEGVKSGLEDYASPKIMEKHLKNTKKLEELKTQIEKLNERVSKIEASGKDYIYLSGAIYLYYGDKAWYLYGASKDDFRDTMTNFTMQWAMISDSIDLGLDIYDFRGVSGDIDENNPLYGLYKFKKGFGGDFVEFIGEYDLVIDNLMYKLFKDLFPKYKKVRAKLRKINK